MAKKLTEEQERAQDQAETVADLGKSVGLAKEIFGTATPTPEMIFCCCDVVFSLEEEYQSEARDELRKSVGIAKQIFAVPAPTAEMVFGVYTRVFGEDDDEDDEDDEE